MFRIQGGMRLAGTIEASGAKNAALPLMTAAILADEPLTLDRVPKLGDVRTLRAMLAELGVASRREDDRLTLFVIDDHAIEASRRLVRRMRASFCVLGPLLAKRRKAIVPLPGGCRLGPRPVDLHLKGLAQLGAEIQLKNDRVIAKAKQLRGATIDLAGPAGPSVTATANVLSAAVLAQGVSILNNVAREPEIEDLTHCLNAMGAKIEGIGTATLVVRGVDSLGGAVHRVIGDRIEAGTMLIAAAVTRGEATITNFQPAHLQSLVEHLASIGASLTTAADSITIRANRNLRARDVLATPYPGLPTDLQAPLMALAATLPGVTHIQDNVFCERMAHIDELRKLGAKIERSENIAIVTGVAKLRGASVVASDLRAGASLVLAGLAAEGTTFVQGARHIRRGYAGLERKLAALGADVAQFSQAEAPSQRIERPTIG